MAALPGRLVLLGHPVSHSLSPSFQNAALASAGLPLEYELLNVAPADLPAVVAELVEQGAAGNVTIPHKPAMLALCADVSALAAHVGGVNTFWVRDGKLTGDNTDVAGFHALVDSVDPTTHHEQVALIGAGGAAGAVVVAMERRGASVVRVFNRTPDRARELAARFGGLVEVSDSVEVAVRDATLVVSSTPPSGPSAAAHAFAHVRPDATLLDLAYAPGGTAWVRVARERGLRAADGLEMLLIQGARAFECWFGLEPDLLAMRAALERAARA